MRCSLRCLPSGDASPALPGLVWKAAGSLFLLSQGGLALLCTLPFAWVDSHAFFDYLFPLWELCASLLLFFLLYGAAALVRARRR